MATTAKIARDQNWPMRQEEEDAEVRSAAIATAAGAAAGRAGSCASSASAGCVSANWR